MSLRMLWTGRCYLLWLWHVWLETWNEPVLIHRAHEWFSERWVRYNFALLLVTSKQHAADKIAISTGSIERKFLSSIAPNDFFLLENNRLKVTESFIRNKITSRYRWDSSPLPNFEAKILLIFTHWHESNWTMWVFCYVWKFITRRLSTLSSVMNVCYASTSNAKIGD